jgi:hypothetical protein
VRASVALLLGALLLPAGAARGEGLAPLGACGPVGRRYDGVEMTGAEVHRLGGTPLARLGLLAFREGRPVPVPFQIDERQGRKIALDGGPEPTGDDKPGVLDADDLLVFMACDAGEQRPAAEVAAALASTGASTVWREVRIEDPLDHTSGFVYLVAAERPPAADRRYVGYQAAGDLVSAARYRIGLVGALPSYFALVTADGAVGPNLVDGLRLRAEATMRADLAHWKLNEQQGRHELIAWKTGPVRVIRRSRHQVVLGLGIRLTAGVANTYFYANHVFGPGSLRLPFSPGVLFRDITAYAAVDGLDLRGWRYHAPGVPPAGFAIDGHMDDAERAFASSGDWFVLAHHEQAILFVTRMSENLRRAVPIQLLYRDDATQPNPPERAPGTVPLAGYEGRGIERLERGRYTFAIHIFVLDRYHAGDEGHVLAELDAPLVATLSGEGSLSAPGESGAVPAAPR